MCTGLSEEVRTGLSNAVGTGLQNVSWPGLSQPPTTLHQPHRKIVPLRISRDDQPNLPGPGPTFQACLALNGGEYVAVGLAVNQAMQLVAPGECRSGSILMCPHPAGECARYADIQRSVRAIGHDVNPGGVYAGENTGGRLTKGLHWTTFEGRMRSHGLKVPGGRANPGHDTNATTHRRRLAASVSPRGSHRFVRCSDAV
jgi:hypothetical protein